MTDLNLACVVGARPNLVKMAPLLKALQDFCSQAKLIITDSDGLEEESTVLGIPCLTARPNTERPITVEEGTSTLVGNDPAELRQVLDGTYKQGRCPELWDGQTANRLAAILAAEAERPGPAFHLFANLSVDPVLNPIAHSA